MIVTHDAAWSAPSDELRETREAIEISKAKQAELAEQEKSLQAELGALQKKLVTLVTSAERAEAEWEKSRSRLEILTRQTRAQREKLAKKQEKLAALTRAALHISRMPPEAAVISEGGARAVTAASALKTTSESIRAEISAIRVQTEELEQLEKRTAARRAEFDATQAVMETEQKTLKIELAKRQELQKKLAARRAEETKKSEELAKKAQDLQALVESASRRAKSEAAGRSPARAKGRLTLPIAGRISQPFGSPGASSNTKRGVVLTASTAGAPVIAPFDGEVVFSGPFLNYGKLVILRHRDDFHTLLAGMELVDAEVGDFLLEGEPIGAMGDDSAGRKLYMELRHHNQPIDPAPWIRQATPKR